MSVIHGSLVIELIKICMFHLNCLPIKYELILGKKFKCSQTEDATIATVLICYKSIIGSDENDAIFNEFKINAKNSLK